MNAIAFVGLGSMGLPMARNLLSAGFDVRGYDLRPEAVKAFAGHLGRGATSAEQALAGVDVAILMVVNATQVEASLFNEGALEGMQPNGSVILTATCSPRDVDRIAERVTATGRRFVAAPVSGGVSGARSGSLTMMVAAEKATFDIVKPVLDALASKIFRVGERPGHAAAAKAVNQLLCGVHIAVAAEALSLAERLGLDLGLILEIVGGSAASSWMLKDRGPRMLESEPSVSSAIDIFVKDLGIVLDAGDGAGTALPLAALARQLFLSVSGRGEGASDDSQVIRAYRSLQGR